MMAAHGANVARWVAILETLRELFEDDADENGDDPDPDGPPHGEDWCRNGCQPLFGMECGMCGYEGRGVRIDQVATVAEYCCHCNARTRQSPDGICELCGKDAETPDQPAPQPASCFWDCGMVSTDAQCRLCRDLERHAQGATLQAGHEDPTAPAPIAERFPTLRIAALFMAECDGAAFDALCFAGGKLAYEAHFDDDICFPVSAPGPDGRCASRVRCFQRTPARSTAALDHFDVAVLAWLADRPAVAGGCAACSTCAPSARSGRTTPWPPSSSA